MARCSSRATRTQGGESDGPVAGVALGGGEDAPLARDLVGLADDGHRAVQQVDVVPLQPEELPGPQPAESAEQDQAPESRVDRLGELRGPSSWRAWGAPERARFRLLGWCTGCVGMSPSLTAVFRMARRTR